MLFFTRETIPDKEPVDDADPREREAARLEVSPAKPGDDPPTYGDEGGGAPYPERSLGRHAEAARPAFLWRLG
jgi:hypothetical protein